MRLAVPVLSVVALLASCADPGGQQVSAPSEVATPTAKRQPDPPVRSIQRGKVTSITFEDFFALQQAGNVLLIDARPVFFYNLGHIPGAINLPRGIDETTVRARDDQFKKAIVGGKTIVTYCTGTTCPDARKLAVQISILGHPVSIFSGGWHAWNDAEMPTE